MKPYYSEFARHCLRYYVKTLEEGKGGCPQFRSEAEKENWVACHEALRGYSERDMEIITYLCRPGDTIPDKIYHLSREMRIPQDTLWNMINTLERNVAKERGLI